MMKRILFFVIGFIAVNELSAQNGEAPNYANSSALPAGAAQASKVTGSINLFTGQPTVSIPIYSFSNNSGISTSVSLEYMGGGIQAGESPSIVGLGWYLSVGGSITRTVRGMPDDMPDYGYMYASAIPADWRTNGSKYYRDSIDMQQDIFQYNFPGHSGEFFIGKNGEIALLPLSKIRVIPAFQEPSLSNQTLKSFRIIAEDGVKYDFDDANYSALGNTTTTPSGYDGVPHATSWNLTRIISPFGNDTITFNYQGGGNHSSDYRLPQITFVNNTTGVRKTPINPVGSSSSGGRKISSITLPDATTVSFVYNYATKYNNSDFALSKIKISDTAFRFGYLFDYDSLYTYYDPTEPHPGYKTYDTRLFLKSVTPYTKNEKQEGYKFDYGGYIFPKVGGFADTMDNKVDYWGYYNGAYNDPDSLIPQVSPYTWGADRTPSTVEAVSSSLTKFWLPTGGYVWYNYELNDHYPYTKDKNTVTIAAATSSQNNITLNQVYNNRHQLVFLLDKSVSRTGSAPISGSGDLNVYVKNTAGTVTYLSTTISLYDLFYSGMRSLTFNLDNGTYRLETSLSGGTSISGSFPVDINWENRTLNSSVNSDPSGGVRVVSISRSDSNDGLDGGNYRSFERYKYIREDGKSSGFLGDIPRYDYPYRETYNYYGTTTKDYTAVCSEPLTNPGFVLGAPVGYSRVEIIQESNSGNLGKEVQEFTDLKDVNRNDFPIAFPFIPQDLRAWGLGLPKRVSRYDSSGNLVQRTVNNIAYDTIVYNNSNFKSIKLGHSQTTYDGDPNTISPSTPKTLTFIGEEYYFTSGRAYVTASRDTLFQTNGSINTKYQNMVYDTNYNVTKVTTSYDKTRGLEIEQRMYYPYNYTIGGGIGTLRDSSIISQTVATESWITGDSNPRITGGAATSFRQIANGDMKPDTIYSFESNKPVVQATIGVFDPAKLNRNTTYFKPQSYFTSYNAKGNLSEVKSLVSGLSNSVITDYDQQYAVAKISNAVQADIAYTSFETNAGGNWTIAGSQRDVSYKLTGKKSYNLTNGNVSKSSLNSSQNYLLTLWVKSGASVSVNSTSVSSPIATQNSWNLYSIPLTGISSVTISGSGLIDEVRLHPKDANMMTYAYEPLIGLISTADANNTVVYNEYDNLNRVKIIRDKDKNIIKRFDYSDTTMTVSTAPNWVGFDKGCSPTNPGHIDSLYQDLNPFSDSLGYVKRIDQGYLDCSCPEISSDPKYKVVYGTCEMGTWEVTSSEYKKVLVDGFLQWRWVCTHRWCFSDGSNSTYYEETIHMSICSMTCYVEL